MIFLKKSDRDLKQRECMQKNIKLKDARINQSIPIDL